MNSYLIGDDLRRELRREMSRQSRYYAGIQRESSSPRQELWAAGMCGHYAAMAELLASHDHLLLQAVAPEQAAKMRADAEARSRHPLAAHQV